MLCRMQKPAVRASAARSSARVSVPRPARLSHFVTRAAVAEKDVAAKTKDVKVEEEEDVVFEHEVPHPTVSSAEVASFLTTLVEDTEIAELHLQVGSFELKVTRSISGKAGSSSVPPPAASAAPAPAAAAFEVASAPVAAAAPEADMDESLVYVVSPKVGIFRRGKYAAGKRIGKGNLVNEGDQIKKGQPLGYVEQLGTHFPVEAPQAGEIAKFVLEEGAPVEFQQLVVEIAPFFGGHIIGDMKHA